MTSLRILCLDQFETLGGAQQCLLDMIPFLAEKKCRTEVLIPGPGAFSDRLQSLDSKVRFFKGARLSRKSKPVWEAVPYLLSLRAVLRTLDESAREAKPDLVYVTGPRYLPAAAWMANRLAVPLLFHAHNHIVQRSARALAGIALRRCHARVIACCDWVASSLRPHLTSARVRVVYNGTPDLANRAVPLLRPIKRVGVIGRIAPEKGQLAFVRAIRRLKNAGSGLEFVVVGSATNQHADYYCALMRESAGLAVTFTGWQDNVSAALARLDLLVVPSLAYDAAPRVVLEAFSACVPVLACPSGGIPELIQDGVNGFLTQGPEPVQLSSRLAEVLNLPASVLAAVAMNARETWTGHYRLEIYQHNVWAAMLACCTAAKTHSY